MEIYYQLPNKVGLELISEIHIQCYGFGPFDTPIEVLLETYLQASGKQKHTIRQMICDQCEFYANTIGYNEDIANLISYDTLANDIEHTLLQAIQQ